MGMATLHEFASRRPCPVSITILARPSSRNRRKLKPFLAMPDIDVIWGDLCDYESVARGVKDSDFVLHLGGLVSPAADYFPEKTKRVNIGGAQNVAKAVMDSGRADDIYVVYIGSIAQLGDHRPPHHWGQTGDPLLPSALDEYAYSKIEAERAIVDSGIPHWVAMRQTGILSPDLLKKGSDPITFHVPLEGVLEWTTAEDSGRLMANLCTTPLPDSFWNNFYNIGSGETYRLTNYEFECQLLKAIHCPAPEKIFDTRWFALYNFHGQWWADSDVLEEYLHFRSGLTMQEYFRKMAASLPFYFRLTPLAPPALIKWGMKMVASKNSLGTLYWLKNNVEDRIHTHFGSREEQSLIPSWEALKPRLNIPLSRKPPKDMPPKKDIHTLTLADMTLKAHERGGECISGKMEAGDMATKLTWKCHCGHIFEASPALIWQGGHWCPECLWNHCHPY